MELFIYIDKAVPHVSYQIINMQCKESRGLVLSKTSSLYVYFVLLALRYMVRRICAGDVLGVWVLQALRCMVLNIW
jgi:hypothetical protein